MTLVGQHKFSTGDEADWVRPEFDDRSWRTIPAPATWVSQGVSWTAFRGCYRMRFELPARPATMREVGLALGVVLGAHEVWLNGTRIGGEGHLGERFTETPWQRVVRRVPDSLLKWGAENVLVVRCQHFSLGGILDGPIALGDFWELSSEVERRSRVEWQWEAVILTFYVMAFAFCVIVSASGVRDREHWWFLAMLLAFALPAFYESRLFYSTGWRTPWVERFYLFGSTAGTPYVAMKFFQFLYRRPRSRGMQAAFVVNGLLAATAFVPLAGWLMECVAIAWLVTIEGMQVVVCVWSWRAWRERQTEALPLLVGTVLANVLLTVTFLPAFGGYWWQGVGLWNFALGAFLVSGLAALVLRFVRLRNRLEWVSSRTLLAHEEERKRLARDLHDGVAQSLLAIQLNLEMMRARVKQGRALDDAALNQLVDESKMTVNELRRVARDLRPETLERTTLAEALRWLAEQCQSRAGLRVAFRADETSDVSSAVKDHLYRICQEVLKNVVTHAKATEATLRLARRDSLLELTISDNGCGFDAGAIESGLGLASVRERAQLLGGMARIDSSPGRGAKISITVPA